MSSFHKSCVLVVLSVLFCSAVADMYLHNPPGSNDRNRERSDNRNNANRLFDSQNNAKGGYPWNGDPVARAAPDPLVYYSGSNLRLEWTNQHQCTGLNVACQVIVQYACNDLMPGLRDGYPDGDTVDASDNNNAGYTKREFNQNNGQNADGTNRIDANQFTGQRTQRLAYYYNVQTGNPGVQFGMHEGIDWYDLCRYTSRNQMLYHSDQNLATNDARATRQNPNADQYGLECQEERDYYPYWRPGLMHSASVTPANQPVNQPAAWFDVAILTNNPDTCDFYKANSQNVRGYGQCLCTTTTCQTSIAQKNNNLIPWDQATCNTNGGTWVPNQGALGVDAPDCLQHDFGRDNHLGNTFQMSDTTTATGIQFQPETAHYNWVLPDRMAGNTCVVRLRYNISTGDYANQNFNAKSATGVGLDASYDCTGNYNPTNTARQGNPPTGTTLAAVPQNKLQCIGLFNETVKPLFNRPYINVYGTGVSKLAIALNSDQSGRTFQDRSYVFQVASPPSGVSGAIWNLNIRGRRGNIVQCYPAVEYDFVPQKMSIAYGDFIHYQMHGSDFNEAKNANDGEGWQFSSRSNMVQTASGDSNFPVPLSQQNLFNTDNGNALAIRFALLDQQNCGDNFQNGVNNDQNAINNCGKLNSAPNRWPNTPQDSLVRMTGTGTHYFVSTRNNNFSNRSQKGMIVVGSPSGLSAGQQAGIAIGVIAGCAVVFGGVLYYGKRNPGSKAGSVYQKVSGCFGGSAAATKHTSTAPDMEYTRH